GRAALRAAAAAIVVGLIGYAVPLPIDGPTARVLAVQGNVPRPGLDFNAERRAVLDNHVRTTLDALDAARAAGQPHPDLVVWPENASDIDPVANADAAAEIQRVADAAEAPVVLGGLRVTTTEVANVSFLWLPRTGPAASYVKQHPVPFAEYIPDRAFWRTFSTQVDLLARDFVAGPGPVLFRAGTAGEATLVAGPSICFEVANDDLVRANVTEGANLLLVQTNNATFGFTNESVQQLAISRLRAIEHGRSVVHVSTVGVSGLIHPDGTVRQPTALFTSAALTGELPLRSAATLATILGPLPEYVAVLVLLTLLGHSVAMRARRRKDSTIT
ncbi:MAG: apolipoprotein N-acyltransferase, partial [Candidatus Phosphoribacter sp.]